MSLVREPMERGAKEFATAQAAAVSTRRVAKYGSRTVRMRAVGRNRFAITTLFELFKNALIVFLKICLYICIGGVVEWLMALV